MSRKKKEHDEGLFNLLFGEKPDLSLMIKKIRKFSISPNTQQQYFKEYYEMNGNVIKNVRPRGCSVYSL